MSVSLTWHSSTATTTRGFLPTPNLTEPNILWWRPMVISPPKQRSKPVQSFIWGKNPRCTTAISSSSSPSHLSQQAGPHWSAQPGVSSSAEPPSRSMESDKGTILHCHGAKVWIVKVRITKVPRCRLPRCWLPRCGLPTCQGADYKGAKVQITKVLITKVQIAKVQNSNPISTLDANILATYLMERDKLIRETMKCWSPFVCCKV